MAEWQTRYTQILLLFTAFTLMYSIRTCMSVAVLAMTDTTMFEHNHVEVFDWPKQIQDYILSAFYFGYIIMQIPSGHLAYKYGGKIMIGFSLISNGLLTLTIPFFSKSMGWKALVLIRIVQGICQGCLFPSVHTLLSKWCPVNERSRASNLVIMGGNFGTILSMPLTGILPKSRYGWPFIFYVLGLVNVLFSVIWFTSLSESPRSHKKVSAKELDLILSSLGEEKGEKKPIPWKSIMTSMPFIAILISHIGCGWGFASMLTQIPSFYYMALGISVENSGILSAIAYTIGWGFSTVASIVCDALSNRKIMSLTAVRKLANTIGSWGPAFCLLLLTFTPLEYKAVIIFLVTAAITLDCCTCIGFLINHLDLSPTFASILVSFTNCIASAFVNVSPIVTSFLIKDNPNDLGSWHRVFYLSGGIYFVSNVVYLLFGSARRQPWDSDGECPVDEKLLDKNQNINKYKDEETKL